MSSVQRNPRSNRRRPGPSNPNPFAATQSSPGNLSRWRQSYERYKGLAESTGSADAVTREGYWQHAEHFIRLIHEAEAAHRPG